MARAGACSRRDAEQWIAEGRVAVNGRVLASPAFNVREGDAITVDGAPLAERERTRLFLFHKPAGLVTSARDPEERETVFAHIERHHPDMPRVVSVGQLDINTEGLLLLTNDGGLARVLELPATGWTRRYRVRAHGEVDQAMLDTLAKGVTVEGVNYAPIEARLDRVQGANAWISMTLTEGKNREIKRVLEHLRLDVTRLIRISFGPFQLGDIAEGAVEEVKLKVLRDQLGKGLAELANVDFAASVREAPSAKEQQERREQAQNRPRKHVSALRKQREEIAEKGPRARIERAITADRKGRAVAVERVIVKGATPLADSRNARRFDKLRRDGAEGDEKAKAARRARAATSGAPALRAPRAARGSSARTRDRRASGNSKAARAPRGGRVRRAPKPESRLAPAASRHVTAPRPGKPARRAPRGQGVSSEPTRVLRAPPRRANAPNIRGPARLAKTPRASGISNAAKAPREGRVRRAPKAARNPRALAASRRARAPTSRALGLRAARNRPAGQDRLATQTQDRLAARAQDPRATQARDRRAATAAKNSMGRANPAAPAASRAAPAAPASRPEAADQAARAVRAKPCASSAAPCAGAPSRAQNRKACAPPRIGCASRSSTFSRMLSTMRARARSSSISSPARARSGSRPFRAAPRARCSSTTAPRRARFCAKISRRSGLAASRGCFAATRRSLASRRPAKPSRSPFSIPPYGKLLAPLALNELLRGGWLAPGALVVIEEAADAALDLPVGLAREDARRYGDTQIIFARRAS